MLIVEGPDAVGKTTFLRKCIAELERRGIPLLMQRFGILPSRWDYPRDYLQWIKPTAASDRFILSEVVYGQQLRGGARLDSEHYHWLEGHMRLVGAYTVVICATETFMQDRVERLVNEGRWADQAFTPEQVMKVNDAFYLERWPRYKPDVDRRVVLAELCPWPTDEHVKLVCDEYSARWEAVKYVNKAR